MALRLCDSVVRVEIDNRERDRVTGELWLHGRDAAIALSLRGNCLRDIAGCRIVLRNPAPDAGDEHGAALDSRQEGSVGDMTASRKVRVLDCSMEELHRCIDEGRQVPSHMGNGVYLEWFSQTNGRVVIESAGFELISLSEPSWRMTADEEALQAEDNIDAIRNWMGQLGAAGDALRESGDDGDDEPMNEFQWERMLKESDARTDQYGALREKYRDHPDREKLVAREMGWKWLDDALDADERGAFAAEKAAWDDDFPELEPNPVTEGVDWVRTEDGDVSHPLCLRCSATAIDLWRHCEAIGLLGEDGDPDLHDMLFQAQTLGAKLAGALNGLAYDEEPDGGFVVACLKRALKYFEGASAALEKVRAKKLVAAERLDRFRADLLDIRQEMLNLMKRFRDGLS